MPEFVTQYWVEWLFGLIAGLCALGYRSLKRKIEDEIIERKALKDGVRSFLRRQIIIDCEEAIRKGYASTELKDSIDDMYHSYHELGGNGVVTRLKDEMLDLPVPPSKV